MKVYSDDIMRVITHRQYIWEVKAWPYHQEFMRYPTGMYTCCSTWGDNSLCSESACHQPIQWHLRQKTPWEETDLATGDRLHAACSCSIFDIVRYTSDNRPPLLEDRFFVAFKVFSCRRFYCISSGIKTHKSEVDSCHICRITLRPALL